MILNMAEKNKMEVYDNVEALANGIEEHFAKHQINGVYFFCDIDDKIISALCRRFGGRACFFLTPSKDTDVINVIAAGIYSEEKLKSSLHRIAKKDLNSKLIIPHQSNTLADYMIINPQTFLDIIAQDYLILKQAPVIVDIDVLYKNEAIQWNNKTLSYSSKNTELRNINITIPVSKGEQIPSDINALSGLTVEKEIINITEQNCGRPIGLSGFSIDENTLYFRGDAIKLSLQQFKMVSALAKGYEIDKEKYWSFKELARMGAPIRVENGYHANDSFMEKLRGALKEASGIEGIKILERKKNKYRFNTNY